MDQPTVQPTAHPLALIADDEPHLAEYLRQRLVALWPGLRLTPVARNGIEAMSLLREYRPDIAFLDIKMPGMSGLEVADSADGCHCVFVTAFDQYAVEAFERDAIDYLLKPYGDDRLQKTIAKLRALTDQHAPAVALAVADPARVVAGATGGKLSWIRAGLGGEVKLIAIDDVCYFHAADKYTTVVTRGGEYLIRTSLKELVEQLDPKHFWQVHRATLVNVREIDEARRDLAGRVSLALKTRPEAVAVSRAYAHLFKQM